MKKTPELLLLLSLLMLFIPALFAGNTEYIVCNGTGFEIGETGRSFYYAGTNCYYLMTYAADQGLRRYVDKVLGETSEMGLTVVRTSAFKDAGFSDDVVKTSAVQILRQSEIEDVKSL